MHAKICFRDHQKMPFFPGGYLTSRHDESSCSFIPTPAVSAARGSRRRCAGSVTAAITSGWNASCERKAFRRGCASVRSHGPPTVGTFIRSRPTYSWNSACRKRSTRSGWRTSRICQRAEGWLYLAAAGPLQPTADRLVDARNSGNQSAPGRTGDGAGARRQSQKSHPSLRSWRPMCSMRMASLPA